MTQMELLTIAHRAITRELKKNPKSWVRLVGQRVKVMGLIRAEKEKNNEQ